MRKSISVCLVALVLGIGVSALAQAPQPGPEAKKMAMFSGNWQYAGEAKATPFAPASKIAGKQTGRMAAGGFAIETTGQESGQFGAIQWGETDVYDAGSKTYRYLGYQNDGTLWQGTGSVAGNVWKYSGTMTVKGISYRVRNEATFTPDGKSFTWKSEGSTDGKTWAVWAETNTTKIP